MKFLFLKPFLKQFIWGDGSVLKKIYQSTLDNIGEAWLISAYPNHESKCLNPLYFNCNFNDIWNNHQELFGNFQKIKNQLKFPHLIKFIEAKDPLSIQIHPNDEYALKNHNEFGKNEFWYILKNNQNPFIIDYLNNDLDMIKTKINNQDFLNVFDSIILEPHQSIYIPAGTIHAIPANTMIYEIQQASDLTYRIYDYDRLGLDQKFRQLHLKQAMDCLIPKTKRLIFQPNDQKLIHNKYFQLEKIKIDSKNFQEYTFLNHFWLEVVVITGSGLIDDHQIKMGDAFIVTSLCNQFKLKGKMELLINTVKK